MAFFRQLCDCFRFFQHRYLAADRIGRSVDPCVVVIAANDPFVRPLAAAQPGDDVARRHHVPVELQLEVDTRRARSDVIGNRQRSAPFLRRYGTRYRTQQRESIPVGDRQNGDLRQGGDVFAVQTPGRGSRADAGSERIAGILRHVHDRAALRAAVIAEGSLRVDVALEVAIVVRVGVDEATDGAVFGRNLRLDAAPRTAVAGDDDLSFDVDPAAPQLLVVFRYSEIHVDQITGHIAVDGVGVECRKLLTGLTRGQVLLQRCFGERGCEMLRTDHLQEATLWSREEHLEFLDCRFVPPRSEERGDEFRVVAVVG